MRTLWPADTLHQWAATLRGAPVCLALCSITPGEMGLALFHFTDGEAEAWRGYTGCPQSFRGSPQLPGRSELCDTRALFAESLPSATLSDMLSALQGPCSELREAQQHAQVTQRGNGGGQGLTLSLPQKLPVLMGEESGLRPLKHPPPQSAPAVLTEPTAYLGTHAPHMDTRHTCTTCTRTTYACAHAPCTHTPHMCHAHTCTARTTHAHSPHPPHVQTRSAQG